MFNQWGYFQPGLEVGHTVGVVGAIALIATLVESLPISNWDNISIVAIVILLGHFWL